MSYKTSTMVVIMAICLAVLYHPQIVFAAHPADNGVPKDISGWYASCAGPSENYGEVTFIAGQDKPAIDSLTDLERYLVGGISRTVKGGSLMPWYQQVYLAACVYYKQFGSWPQVLSIDELKQLDFLKGKDDAQFEIYRNPLTGNWPRLDARDPAPGDMYLKPLTVDEMQHFAALHSHLQQVWFDGVGTDWNALRNGQSFDQTQTRQVKLVGPVCYVRVYGLRGVLLTDFVYATE